MLTVSVIVPAYNRAGLLRSVANSVLSQTLQDLELIIIDDGSTDETRSVCEHLCRVDSRVRYIHQENQGPCAARNAGICAAQGQYIAFLDSDDLWERTKLTRQLSAANANPDAGVIYCDWAYLNEAGITSPSVSFPDRDLPTMYESLLYDNLIQAPSLVLVRVACLACIGVFDESLRGVGDWDMWLRLAEHCRFVKVPEVLAYLLRHDGQMQRDAEGMSNDRIAVVEKIKISIPINHRHHLAKVLWHNYLSVAEILCPVSRRKGWHAFIQAVNSWPLGVLSVRTWYVLTILLGDPIYSTARVTHLVLRRSRLVG